MHFKINTSTGVPEGKLSTLSYPKLQFYHRDIKFHQAGLELCNHEMPQWQRSTMAAGMRPLTTV